MDVSVLNFELPWHYSGMAVARYSGVDVALSWRGSDTIVAWT